MYILDTPCAAGARSTSFHPAVTTSENVSLRKLCQEVPYQGGSGGTLFLLISCKKTPNGCRKRGPWTGRYHFLSSLESSSLLDPSKSRAQTTTVQEQWSRLHIRLAKINYLPKNGRTNEQLDLMYGTDGKSASRNKWSEFINAAVRKGLIVDGLW